MKKIFLVLLFLQVLAVHALAGGGVNQAEEISFMNIAWGEDSESACRKIKRNNFLEVQAGYTDLRFFEGTIFDKKSDIMVGLINNAVHSVDIHFAESNACLELYAKVNTFLKKSMVVHQIK